MHVILSTVKCQLALVYLGDIKIFSNLISDQLPRLRSVLGFLSDAAMSLILKKCYFFENEIDYLGHVKKPWKSRQLG